MSRDDIQKLLGGYATGTLTPEEQQALFEAALTDQELFDALAREEPLREALSDPSARAQMLAALDDVPAPWYRQWWRPMLVTATVLSIVVGVAVWQRSQTPAPVSVAKVELPRFQVPASKEVTPVLPQPPEVKQPLPVYRDLPLPLAAPPAPPPPVATAVAAPQALPAPSALKKEAGIVLDGAVGGVPAQQSQQAPMFQELRQQQQQQFAPASGAPTPAPVAPARSAAPASPPAAAADSVEVTAASNSIVPMEAKTRATAGLVASRAGSGGGGRGGRGGVSFLLQRTVPGEAPVAVPAGGNLPKGSVLTLRITPAADSAMRIVIGDVTIAADVKQGIASDTVLPAFDKTGRVQIQVYFGEQPTPALSIPLNIR